MKVTITDKTLRCYSGSSKKAIHQLGASGAISWALKSLITGESLQRIAGQFEFRSNNICRFMPEDFMIEHYADGDQVNCHTETSTLPASDEALAIWGPAVREWRTYS